MKKKKTAKIYKNEVAPTTKSKKKIGPKNETLIGCFHKRPLEDSAQKHKRIFKQKRVTIGKLKTFGLQTNPRRRLIDIENKGK